MHTPNNAYTTKFNSGIIVALLAFSGLVILVPFVAPVSAATANNPTVSVYPGALWGAAGYYMPIVFNITNPSSNTVGISQITLNGPAAFTAEDCSGVGGEGFTPAFLTDCTYSGTVITFYSSGSGNSLPPGATVQLGAPFGLPSSLVSYPGTYSITTSWQDTAGDYHAGPTLTAHVFDPSAYPTLVTKVGSTYIGPLSSGYKAGAGASTITGNIGVANKGVIVSLFAEFGNGVFSGSGVTCISAAICYTTTSSTGAFSATYQPSNLVGTTYVFAIIGGFVPSSIDCGWIVPEHDNAYSGTSTLASDCGTAESIYNSTSITTVAGNPSSVTWTLPGSATSTAPNHYETTYGTDSATKVGAETAGSGISFSLADKFGNSVDFSSLTTPGVTLVAAGTGRFDFGAGTTYTAIQCGVTPATWTCPTSGTSYTLSTGSINYFQGTTYGTIGQLSASIYDGATLKGTGHSGSIITSTFSTTSPTPVIGGNPTPTTVKAGHSFPVAISDVTDAQKGVPVTFWLDMATSVIVNGDGHFSTGLHNITATTNSTGGAHELYSADTGAGAVALFLTSVSRPIDGNPSAFIGNGTDSTSVTTQFGSAAKLNVKLYYDSGLATAITNGRAVNGTDIFINAILQDAYGNTVTNNGGQIQLTISVSAGGVISASTVYIPTGDSDTYTGFGTITWTTSSSLGSETVSFSGVVAGNTVSGSKSITVVGPKPTFSITAPTTLAGIIYSDTSAVFFQGWANASTGYDPSGTTMSSVMFDSSAGEGSASVSNSFNATWTAPISFSSGFGWVIFNATDSNGNTFTSVNYTLLVDTANPTVKFTTSNNANLTAGDKVTAVVIDSLGDINMSSVAATKNGSAIPSSSVSVSGTNMAGSNVTYTVTISGLSAGTWDLGLAASDYAGNTGTATDITVHVSVPPNQVFTSTTPVIGTSSLGFKIVSATWTNNGVGSVTADYTFEIFQGSTSGAPVALGLVESASAAGSTSTVSFGIPSNLASGSYTAAVFVTAAGSAYSQVYTVQFTVS
jgi:hypothetical protein